MHFSINSPWKFNDVSFLRIYNSAACWKFKSSFLCRKHRFALEKYSGSKVSSTHQRTFISRGPQSSLGEEDEEEGSID